MTNVREGASSQLTFSVRDSSGVLIPKASLLTLTLKLYDVDTLGVINSRNYTSVFDVNGGVVNTDGTGTVTLAAADNPIMNSNRLIGEMEVHGAVLKFTASGGASGNAELRFNVQRIA